jgi:chromosome segregation ATPase
MRSRWDYVIGCVVLALVLAGQWGCGKTDQTRIAAERAFAEAGRLEAESSLRQAVMKYVEAARLYRTVGEREKEEECLRKALALSSSVLALRSECADFESQVDELESQLESVRSGFDDVKTAFDDVQSALESLKSEIEDFRHENWRDNVLDVKSAFDDLESALVDLERAIRKVDSEL